MSVPKIARYVSVIISCFVLRPPVRAHSVAASFVRLAGVAHVETKQISIPGLISMPHFPEGCHTNQECSSLFSVINDY